MTVPGLVQDAKREGVRIAVDLVLREARRLGDQAEKEHRKADTCRGEFDPTDYLRLVDESALLHKLAAKLSRKASRL